MVETEYTIKDYYELIISKNRIADPIGTISTPPPTKPSPVVTPAPKIPGPIQNQTFATSSPSAESTPFSIGARVEITSGSVSVHITPDGSKIRGYQKVQSVGNIVEGPFDAEGYSWWRVNFTKGIDGWVIENHLRSSMSSSVTKDAKKRSKKGISPSTTAPVVEKKNESDNSKASSRVYLPVLVGPFALGAKGDQVKVLQTYLSQDSSLFDPSNITGFYGPLTKAAVLKFQERNNIEKTGIAGPLTRNKLTELHNSQSGDEKVLSAEERLILIKNLQQQILSLQKQLQTLKR